MTTPCLAGRVLVIGGGPAGLMAAETISAAGYAVDLCDAMPSVGRKFLLAGKGGMNLTHAEPAGPFLERYTTADGSPATEVRRCVADFGADQVRQWCSGLGVETFVGSSGRIFPVGMKAAPLLRAWLRRLREGGVQIHVRHRWIGIGADRALRFATASGQSDFRPDATVLALGGGSWPQLGSDGRWVDLLGAAGIGVAPLEPANCGFDVAGWSPYLRERFAGAAIKSIALRVFDASGVASERRGEFVLTASGVEGGLIYALSARLRDTIRRLGKVVIEIDLLPDRSQAWVNEAVSHPRGSRSLSSHLQSRLGLKGAKVALLRELLDPADFAEPSRLAGAIKALPLQLENPRPLAEAISSAGGVRFDELDDLLMLKRLPGVFCAGEMLDWEAPTGGYLLTASFATGRAAGIGAIDWLRHGAMAGKLATPTDGRFS